MSRLINPNQRSVIHDDYRLDPESGAYTLTDEAAARVLYKMRQQVNRSDAILRAALTLAIERLAGDER